MSVEVQLKRFKSMERRPKMLKEFLSENSNPNSNSSRRIPNGVVTVTNSKSTFQTVIKTIRNISFFTMTKSPSVLSLPRSLSRKLSSRRRRGTQTCNSTVKIKDIMRWKSFRDLQPSVPSPSESVTTTTTSCNSGGSSWSDGDFFTDSWEAQNDCVEVGKKVSLLPFFVGNDDSVAPFVGAQEDLTCQEDEQNSPVSVLQFGEKEFSLFDKCLANIERRKQKFKQTVQKLESLANFDLASLDKFLSLDEKYEDGEDDDHEEDQKSEEHDWVEKRAKQLLHCVKVTSSSLQGCDDDYLGEVVLDFFREELATSRNQNGNDEGFELDILRTAKDWIKGSFAYEDIVHVNKDGYIKDMDRRGGWSRFEEEQEELVLEIEADILNNLVVDLLDLDCQ